MQLNMISCHASPVADRNRINIAHPNAEGQFINIEAELMPWRKISIFVTGSLEIVVAVDVGVVIHGDPAEDLHADYAVNEEDERDEQGNPGQRLEGLEEGPEQGADPLVLVQQLDETRHTEQTQEPNTGVTVRLHNR